MLKFNNNHIFTGYLKQLLSEFNLPTIRIYSNEQHIYERITGGELNVFSSVHRKLSNNISNEKPIGDTPNNMRYIPYIKDTLIQEYVYDPDNGGKKWEVIKGDFNYFYNKKMPQFTKNLIIKNGIYDSYTHEYFGNYLRFQRDFNGIDLMPLYNCFSNRICNNLYINVVGANDGNRKLPEFCFDSRDDHYKIYMIPIKFFQKYTIAIDSDLPIEMCCGLYGKYQNTDEKLIPLYRDTYFKTNGTIFAQPFIYDKIFNLTPEYIENSAIELATKEGDLKLFIKIPFLNTSSITILEGDYTGYNDSLLIYTDLPEGEKTADTDATKNWKILANHTVTNYQEDSMHPEIERRKLNFITPLQLLRINTGESYPFADRIIEYMLGNVITEFDKLDDNVARVQKVMSLNHINSKYSGIWEKKIRAVMYDFINKNAQTRRSEINHDILGYVDKDVEKFYSGYEFSSGKTYKYTISNIDIYPEMYNSKEK